MYIQWRNQVLYYSTDNGATWHVYSTHPLAKPDYQLSGLSYGSPSRGFATAQALLKAGYKYAKAYELPNGRIVTAVSEEAAKLL